MMMQIVDILCARNNYVQRAEDRNGGVQDLGKSTCDNGFLVIRADE
jgi:hypothetical protein